MLLIPFDVALRDDPVSYPAIGILWQVCFISIAGFSFGLIPFAIFLYETDEDDRCVPLGESHVCFSCACR